MADERAGGGQDGSGTGSDAAVGYEGLRERFWELASVEGVSLSAFIDDAVATGPGPAEIALLCRLVEDVEDTILQNIALKSSEEGGVFETMADERIEEVQEERAVLLDRLRSLPA